MQIFVDSANLGEILKATKVGLCDGITTNPSLLAKEAGKPLDVINEICNNTKVPLHVEVLSEDSDSMIEEGIKLRELSPNIVIKIPMNHEGLKAVYKLRSLDIKTNVTLVFSAAQAILAIKAGANHVCPFLGRLDDIGYNGLNLIKEILSIKRNNFRYVNFQIVAASIRSPLHVVELAKLGVDILTVPSKVLTQMENHPLTDIGISQFNEAAKQFK